LSSHLRWVSFLWSHLSPIYSIGLLTRDKDLIYINPTHPD
jgi:hypothetical protein